MCNAVNFHIICPRGKKEKIKEKENCRLCIDINLSEMPCTFITLHTEISNVLRIANTDVIIDCPIKTF